MVESILETILDIVGRHKYSLKTLIEGITLLNNGLEVCTTRHDNTFDIWDIIGDEILRGQLRNLFHVVQSLLFSDSRKSVSGLTTSAVLLGQLDRDFLLDNTDIALEGGEEGAGTVDDDEAELLVVLQQEVEH